MSRRPTSSTCSRYVPRHPSPPFSGTVTLPGGSKTVTDLKSSGPRAGHVVGSSQPTSTLKSTVESNWLKRHRVCSPVPALVCAVTRSEEQIRLGSRTTRACCDSIVAIWSGTTKPACSWTCSTSSASFPFLGERRGELAVPADAFTAEAGVAREAAPRREPLALERPGELLQCVVAGRRADRVAVVLGQDPQRLVQIDLREVLLLLRQILEVHSLCEQGVVRVDDGRRALFAGVPGRRTSDL